MVITTPFVPHLVLSSLENRYEPIQIDTLPDLNADYHIIVLGGGHGFDRRLPPNSLLSLQALARLNEGIRLHRELPNSTLVLSGSTSGERTTQAEMLQMTALLLGVDEASTLVQTEPANTWQEARVYSETHGNRHPLILVTSAAHMHRAVRTFELFGMEPIPSPAHYRIKKDHRSRSWLPAMRNMEFLRAGFYEYAGILGYGMRDVERKE